MALPLQVADICHRYKTGQKHVVQWLSDAAARHGCFSMVISGWDGYLARKVEEQYKKDCWSLQPIKLVPVVPLSTVQLVTISQRLADTAADDKQALHGFEDTMLILEDVIKSRRECAQYYVQESRRCDTARRNYDSHMEFVSSLTDVLGHLRRLHAPQTRKAPRKGRARRSGPVQVQQSTNAYQMLSMEEFQDPVPDAPSLVDSRKSLSSIKKAKVPHHTGRPAVSQVWDLLRECHSIRQYVRDTWQRHIAGELSSVIAAQTTDHALWLIRATFQDFVEAYPSFTDFDSISQTLGVEACFSGDTIEGFTCKDPTTSPYDSPSQLLCAEALLGLSILRGALHPDDTRRGLDLIDAAAVHPLLRHFLDALIELIALGKEHEKMANLGGGDTFLQWMIAYIYNLPNDMSFEWVQAFQMHMDIYTILEGRGIRECIALRTHAEVIQRAHQSFNKIASDLPHLILLSPEFLRSSGRELVQSTISALNTPYRDPETARRTGQVGDVYRHEVVSRLFIRFPTVPGHTSRHLTDSYYADGIATCNLDSPVLSLVHLYTACRVSGTLKKKWRALEFVIEQQGKATFGLVDAGVSPNKMLHAAKYFGLALGVDPKEYLKRSRRPQKQSIWTRVRLPRNLRRMKKMVVKSRLSAAFQRFGVVNASSANTQPHALRLSLEQTAIDMQKSCSGASNLAGDRRPASPQSLTSVQILSLVQDSLLDEELQLHFDYLSFLGLACHVLGLIPAQCVDRVPYAAEDVEDKLPHELVDFILWDAAQREEGGLPQTLLTSAALIFEAAIRVAPDTHLRVAKFWTSEGADDPGLATKPMTKLDEVELTQGPRVHMKGSKIVLVERSEQDVSP